LSCECFIPSSSNPSSQKPPDLRDAFAFQPGQFLTLKAQVNGEFIRRSYSICSSAQQLESAQEISVGIKRVEGGAFSTWAQGLQTGDEIDVMPPDGRFTSKSRHATRRLLIAAGSGITPMMSLLGTLLAREGESHFTLIYGNQSIASTMFLESLQDLKDRYPTRLSLVHVLSRQKQELARFNGRLDRARLDDLFSSVVQQIPELDEAFICGPEAMIDAAEAALQSAGLAKQRIHTERFGTSITPKTIATNHVNTVGDDQNDSKIPLVITLDGVRHALSMSKTDTVLEVALSAGLDLPYSCKAGVCCTCRAKVTQGSVQMLRNFTLEANEVQQGFALTCQSCPTSPALEVSFDER
jgi:ring-1,2-phenylacetyl-CoA epoxidase subunit PaaE